MSEDDAPATLGTQLPDGVRFVGREGAVSANWTGNDHPADADLDACVACGLCLPHCPTYRLTGDESASPRGRIAAMRAVADGLAEVDDTFATFMDRCLVCRACEDVCPSHVPFGRMMEHARAEIEPRRGAGARVMRWLGLDLVLPHPSLIRLVGALQPIAHPLMPRRIRALVPRRAAPLRRLPALTEPPAGVETRGTVALLAGCVHGPVVPRREPRHDPGARANGVARVTVPRAQRCCGALQAHNGRLETARRLAERNARAFSGVDHVIADSAGCGAHMQTYGELAEGTELPVRDVIAFLHDEGTGAVDLGPVDIERVAYHDACHALRVQGIHAQPRALLGTVPGLQVVDIPDGDRCCGAAGLYNVTEPQLAERLQRDKAAAVRSTGARVIASANPGCTMQLRAGLAALGVDARVVHPIELLDAAVR